MVLELEAPDESAFSALWPLWPTAMSYAVSYLFIAIILIRPVIYFEFQTTRPRWMSFVAGIGFALKEVRESLGISRSSIARDLKTS